MKRKRIISRPVWVLSLVSLFTDISSEMLYPVMPIFLRDIGFGILLIAVLEGIAEATAGLSKGYFGQWSDHKGKRLPFIRMGYLLSALSKPMMAAFVYPLWIFFARTTDRLGKGIRTGARDAYLSDCSTPEHKGKVFGFHRSLDTVGAFLGPFIALVFLHFLPGKYRWLFILAFIPGVVSIAFTLFLKEPKTEAPSTPKVRTHFFGFVRYMKSGPKNYTLLVAGLLAFALVNSSDMLLLLRMKENGLPDEQLILVYIFYNVVYAIFAYPMGMLGDRIGLKKTFIMGLLFFALVYSGMIVPAGIGFYLCLFLIYGIYTASTESISKAWITNIVDKQHTATAIGAYTAFQSVFSFFASLTAGLIWVTIGPEYAFGLSAAVALLVAIYLILAVPYDKPVKITG